MLIVCLMRMVCPCMTADFAEKWEETGEGRKMGKAGPGRLIQEVDRVHTDLRLQVDNIENVDNDRLIIEVNGLFQCLDWIFGGPERKHDLNIFLSM